MLELRNTIDELVCSVQIMIAWMTKTLVPEHAFSSSFDGVDGDGIIDPFLIRKRVEEGCVLIRMFLLEEGTMIKGVAKLVGFPKVGNGSNSFVKIGGKSRIMFKRKF